MFIVKQIAAVSFFRVLKEKGKFGPSISESFGQIQNFFFSFLYANNRNKCWLTQAEKGIYWKNMKEQTESIGD